MQAGDVSIVRTIAWIRIRGSKASMCLAATILYVLYRESGNATNQRNILDTEPV
ncbi:hypothetical protein NTE_00518 [Candidatus Nitrososphaera evergladensis SR1]|uniref:Uncharacterized protein n=1 Tax=Candidatus Nitrososphaera evergladensis SR1 TaxID=1459636 RepID=A0A075MTH7_9ARCH|nr:hypothetical protein [Candidatus Nitrososphaera evergladensis]AIF82599.1 hypothetical protein NTE_00518 [Candidatus Nitrososphaera evergladensis SR1]